MIMMMMMMMMMLVISVFQTKQVNGPYISTEFTYELFGAMAKKQRPFQIRRNRVL